MNWYDWVFDNPQRAARCVAAFFLALIVGGAVVFGYRIHQLRSTLAEHKPTPTVSATASTLPLVPVTVAPSVNPLSATSTPNPVGTTPFTYPDAGDPLPTAIDGANWWIGSQFSKLEGITQPGIYQDLSTNPAPAGLEIDGTAVTTESGPTASEVDVPTSKGDLLVDLVTDGTGSKARWVISGMGWSNS